MEKVFKLLVFITLFVLYEVTTIPLNISHIDQPLNEDDPSVNQEEYENLKHILVYDGGYTQEFADLVEINLKRAISEEKQRQLEQNNYLIDSPSSPSSVRQNQGQGSDEYDDDTTPGITTPRASPGDVVRGIAQLVTSLGTFNVGNFWGSFVNFFPPGQRESAQAVVDAALGRRPLQWPTTPTTTTQLPTTTKDEDESEETTRVSSGVAQPSLLGAPTASSMITAYIPGSALPVTIQTTTVRTNG